LAAMRSLTGVHINGVEAYGAFLSVGRKLRKSNFEPHFLPSLP
jgi:hypothetical protein